MLLCDSILSKDIMAECDAIAEVGFRKKAWMFNYEDVEDMTIADNGEVTAFTLKSGKRGYTVLQQGRKPYEGTNSALVVGNYRNSFTHQVKLYIPDSKDAGELVDQVSTGKFIIMLNNGDGGVRVYGAHNGLVAVECTQTPYNEDSDAGWVVTLEETKSKASRLVYKSTSADVEKELDGLCAQV